MAKRNANLVLLAAGAVVVGLLLLSKKGNASTGTPSLTPGEGKQATPKKPTVEIDADDEGPSPRVDVEVDSPRIVETPPSMVPNPPGDGMPLPLQDEVLATRDPEGSGRWSVTNEDGSPVASNAALAKQKAQGIADHVRTKRNAYDRPKLAVWQALAGLPGVDGLYGPATQAALQRMGAKNVPKPLFKGGN